MLWTAAEMAAAGIPAGADIVGVEFNKTNAGTFNGTVPFKMYVANTSNTTLNTTDTWSGVLTTHTPVIDNTTYNVPSTAGWVTYTFSSPFSYSGGAFEVASEYTLSGLTSPHSTDGFKWEYTSGSSDKIVATVSATSDVLSSTTTAYKHRPNIRIIYSSGACTSPPTAGAA
ncbi:MAG: hypothetical protein LPJ89_03020, partial [Hymenobacteraceae bacterium]|nr:hypothetical protein [Hymenobacteraceae bacterium]MDX5442736.1 hypothetical protein [Hymenobacteraceae bacterium]